MKNKGEKPTVGVHLPSTFPQQEVADHEVFMSFTNDSDALAFREWWADTGRDEFVAWLKSYKAQE